MTELGIVIKGWSAGIERQESETAVQIKKTKTAEVSTRNPRPENAQVPAPERCISIGL